MSVLLLLSNTAASMTLRIVPVEEAAITAVGNIPDALGRVYEHRSVVPLPQPIPLWTLNNMYLIEAQLLFQFL